MKRLFACCLLFIICLFGCQSQKSDVRVIKVGLSHPPKHSFTLALNKMGALIEKESQGRFQLKIYHSAQIGGEKELQEMLTIGTAEMTVTGLLNTYEPLFAVFEMPYLYQNREHVFDVMTGDVVNEVSQSLIPKGLRLLSFYENGYRNITNSRRSIESAADVKGMMIRTPENPAQIETFKALGAIATPLPFSELYTALLQGVVDGQENPLQNIWSSRIYEAQKHLAMTRHIYNAAYLLVSERFWQSLNAEDQTLIQSCARRSTQWQLDYMKQKDIALEDSLKAHGLLFTYPDQEEFKKACEPAYEVIYKKLGSKAEKIVNRIGETADES